MSVSLDSPQPQQTPTNPFSHLLNSISSYDGNVMLAAVISLLCVILFVLLLHAYAKWFLAQARQRTTPHHHHQPSSLSTVSRVFRPDHHRFHHFHAFTFETSTFFSSPTKGLDSSAISSLPLFVYRAEEYKHGLECVICLSGFEENDVGRNLPKCGHGFHVECIDMWLNSHSNCPICRAPVMSSSNSDKVSAVGLSDSDERAVSSSLEIVVGEVGVVIDGSSRLENLTTDSSDSNNRTAVNDDNQSSSPSSSLTLSSTLGCSLKRMLSRNRSERKVFPSSNTNTNTNTNISELEV